MIEIKDGFMKMNSQHPSIPMKKSGQADLRSVLNSGLQIPNF
jgi:hypothetical protein